MPAQPELQKRIQSIERLLGEIESTADPSLRSAVQELVQSVMDLHGAGIERMLEVIGAAEEGSDRIIQTLGQDELVASLLVLYGLHPVSMEERVARALDKIHSRIRSHEGEVELLSAFEGTVRLRLQANGHGCGSTAQALKEAVENAIYQAAPDITSLIIEGGDEKQGFIPLETLRASVPRISDEVSLVAGEKGGL
jgi:Fe-S cluster biogenesis protein NfuA